MSVVRQEFGPTLPELLGPRVRAWPRAARWALAAACAVVVAGIAWLLLTRGGGERTVVRTPIEFNLSYAPPLHRTAPRPGEVLRLQARGSASPQSFAVRVLRIPQYRGDVGAALAIMSSHMIDRMAATIPGFAYRGEGKARVNTTTGYQISYQGRIGGRLTYGRRVMLVSPNEAHPRTAAQLDLLAARSPTVPTADSVGGSGALKLPLRSFRFGTQGP